MSAQVTLKQQKRQLPQEWKPGQTGNPKGRPVGTRHKFSQMFLENFLANWKKRGAKAIDALATESPALYVKLAAEIALPHLRAAQNDPERPNTGAIFDPASFIAGALVGRTNRNHAAPLPDRPVLAPEIRTIEAGHGEAMDSGPLPGSRE